MAVKKKQISQEALIKRRATRAANKIAKTILSKKPPLAAIREWSRIIADQFLQ